MIVNQPFEVTATQGQFRVEVNVYGGGVAAQAVAIRHGITRALLEINPEYRPVLKKAGFITRDSREVERKKYGRHKARKRPQYSKR
jgi:small subunit ribosomal protein S9